VRRGFLITVSALLLLMSSVLFIQNNQKVGRDEERAIGDAVAVDSAAYMFDDVAGDLSSMLGPAVSISRNSSESNITFIEQLPRSFTDSSLLSNYSSFIANYSNETNSGIALNFSGVLNGTLLIFSNGLQYDRNMTSVRFHSSSGSTNASAYELSIFSNDYRNGENISSISSQQSGSMKLIVHYSDLNGSSESSGTFDPNSVVSYYVSYLGDPASALRISVGNISGSGSIEVDQAGSLQVGVNLTARGGWNGSLAYGYNVNMSYAQLNVGKNDLVWVERD
jgi:hypothetical protein